MAARRALCCLTFLLLSTNVSLQGVTTATTLPTVYSQPPSEEHQLEKSTILETLPALGKEWQVSFDFKPEHYNTSGYTNILHLTIGGNTQKIGERIPAIFHHPSSGLIVTTAINTNPNFHAEITPPPPMGQWATIVLSQLNSGSSTTFSVTVNGVAAFSPVLNPGAQEFSSVKVYASDPWHSAQPGSIRHLTIKTIITGVAINAPKVTPGTDGSCGAKGSLSKCAQCLKNRDCIKGYFCCPFQKLCMKGRPSGCVISIADFSARRGAAFCSPSCSDSMDNNECTCENKEFPDSWCS